jgi:hypothetical protein
MRNPDRRTFFRLLPAAALVMGWPVEANAFVRRPAVGRPGHPEPRPGIDGSRVLKADQLAGDPETIELFDHVREIPHIVDGIRCSCGCADEPGIYSLLSCYEGSGMARFCDTCKAGGRIAYERFSKGDSLAQIRRHIDGALG